MLAFVHKKNWKATQDSSKSDTYRKSRMRRMETGYEARLHNIYLICILAFEVCEDVTNSMK